MSLRELPSVDQVLSSAGLQEILQEYGRTFTLEAVRASLDAHRIDIQEGALPPSLAEVIQSTLSTLETWFQRTLVPVINATGVILHTNLGRAPLSQSAILALQEVAGGYSTLEYDLPRGRRGRRDVHAEALLTRLTGGQAALVLNNNAAALLLLLAGLAKRKEVILSRSQLIEIGGGFRIPEIMKQSGAKLVEVGTTNRTHLVDYQAAINERTRLILRVHHSNFRIIGFTTEPSLNELVELGRQHDLLVADDLGSGALLDTSPFGLGHEPTVQESLQAGATLVAFSGDKLLGGPQAGILVGDRQIVDQLRKHPLARALRPDKLCLAALRMTLLHYVKGEALQTIPIWMMISASENTLQERAADWQRMLGVGEVISGHSTVGGGSLPEETLPTWLLAIRPGRAQRLADLLRRADPPIIARIEADQVLFDPRTVLPQQEAVFRQQVHAILQQTGDLSPRSS